LSQQIQNQPQPAEPGEIPRLLQGRRSQREWTLDEITRETARCFSIKISEIRGKKRQKNIVAARNMAIWLARHLTSATLQELGRWFSHRDHSTILHGFHEMDAQLSQNPELQNIFRQIIKKLDAEQWFQNFTAGL
ncbi:MAG: hypothetical protein IKW74_01120, partial [Thermoguttaceae bacterium]|nr:hypothetical protein [Thermoguttaceae bacterium]